MSTKKELEQPWSLKKIDAHVAKHAVKAKDIKGKDVATTICMYYTVARPVIVFLANLLGKKWGAAFISFLAGMDSYCNSSDSAKSVSSSLCNIWSKISTIVKFAAGIFGRAGWAQAISAFAVALDSWCANPA